VNGVELAFRLRKSRPEIPVILMTGYAAMAEQAVKAGFVVLGKPIEPNELFERLKHVLKPAA
jgi:CheY-like chemotaxis protein